MTSTSSITSNDSNQWERAKENAAPLARGRNVQTLEKTVFSTEEDSVRADQMLQHFEQLVSTCADESQSTVKGDPLVDWLSYIKFHQESFPSATHDQFLLLERCFRAFVKHPQYANDGRYVRVCCLFADATQDPVSSFQEIYKLGIGHKSATFWNAWAFVAEKHQDFNLAEQIFEKAIRKEAQPLQFLLLRQKRFQRRMSRHFLSLTQNEQDSDSQEGSRGILGSLREDAVGQNDRRSSSAVLATAGVTRQHHGWSSASSVSTFVDRNRRGTVPQSSSSTTNDNRNGLGAATSFAIHQDADERSGFLDDSVDLLTLRVDREREQDRWKENRLAAERWNQRGSLANTSAYSNHNPYRRATTTISTAFCIHVDKECIDEHEREEEQRQRYSQHQRLARDDRTVLREHTDSVSESLGQDPFFYVRNPQQVGTSEEKADGNPRDKKMRKGIPKTMWKNRLLIAAGGNEQCFEEARLQRVYYKIAASNHNFNNLAPPASKVDDSSMSMSMEELAPANNESLEQVYESSIKQCVAPLSSSFLRIQSSFENPTPRNTSNASSTIDQAVAVGGLTSKEEQTINTQFALRELSMMFSSPAFGLNESKTTADHFCCYRHDLNESRPSASCGSPQVGEVIFETSAEVGTNNSNGSFAHQEAVNNEHSDCDDEKCPGNGVLLFATDDLGKDGLKPGFQIYEDF